MIPKIMILKYFMFLVCLKIVCSETILDPTYSKYGVLYDDISTSSDKIWNKREITWCVVNYTEAVGFYNLIEIMDKVYYEWESISYLKFRYESSYNECDNKIYFVDTIHKINNKDKNFDSESVLAHGFYPPEGGIHFNINVNFSRISLYNVALHEVGHTLGLSHVMDENSIMFPYYIEKPDNYTLKNNLIDETIIKKKYSMFKEPVELSTTKSKIDSTTIKPVDPTYSSKTINYQTVKTIEPFTQATKTVNKYIYPGYNCIEETNWCTNDLAFTNIFSLDNKLYLYKEDTFWILEKNSEGIMKISKEKYNHQIYFNELSSKAGLISIFKINKHNNIILIFRNKLIVKSLDNCLLNHDVELKEVNNQLNLNVTGVYYNNTEDSMFFFSKNSPLSYTKISKFTEKNNIAEEKPIELFKLTKFDYDKVFEFDNKVFFMKNLMLDYFDWSLKILVKNISFKNYFLKDECDLLPFIKY